MRARGAALISFVALAACGGSNYVASHTPTVPPATSTPTSSSSANPTSAPGPASLVHCTTAVPAGDNLVIGTVVGDPTVVVRDIQDPANAKTVCTFDQNVVGPEFVSGSTVVYESEDRQIIEAPLAGGPTTVVASYSGTPFNSGQYAVSPDGRSLTYLDINVWHLVGPTGNRILTTLPARPDKAINPDQDDSFLSYSPDGQYIALFQTFHVGGTGETAPDQIRRASDGALVYSTSGMTMAVWASVPSRLYFRDTTGHVFRWDPSTGKSTLTTASWIRPKSSPDGRWIAFTIRTPSGFGGVGFYSVQSNSVTNTTPPGRSGVVFLSNDLVWYMGEKACVTNCAGQPTMPSGVTYIYSIAGASEVTARLASVFDAWPHQTAPGI